MKSGGWRDIYIPTPIVVLFSITKTRKQHECPSADDFKGWSLVICRELKLIFLRGISHAQKELMDMQKLIL